MSKISYSDFEQIRRWMDCSELALDLRSRIDERFSGFEQLRESLWKFSQWCDDQTDAFIEYPWSF